MNKTKINNFRNEPVYTTAPQDALDFFKSFFKPINNKNLESRTVPLIIGPLTDLVKHVKQVDLKPDHVSSPKHIKNFLAYLSEMQTEKDLHAFYCSAEYLPMELIDEESYAQPILKINTKSVYGKKSKTEKTSLDITLESVPHNDGHGSIIFYCGIFRKEK